MLHKQIHVLIRGLKRLSYLGGEKALQQLYLLFFLFIQLYLLIVNCRSSKIMPLLASFSLGGLIQVGLLQGILRTMSLSVSLSLWVQIKLKGLATVILLPSSVLMLILLYDVHSLAYAKGLKIQSIYDLFQFIVGKLTPIKLFVALTLFSFIE